MKVSVIIPAYNAQEWITRCLDSIMTQSYRNLEIIVLNDGSRDKTLEIIQQFAKGDSRIVLIDKKNTGTYLTRKMGFNLASGEMILNIDADDYLEPGAIELLLKKMQDEQSDIVICNHYKVVKGRKHLIVNKYPENQSRIGLIKGLLKNEIKGYVWGRIYKRHLINQLNFEVNNLLQEDFLINLIVLLNYELKISVESRPLYNYVIHEQSANSSRNPDFIENIFGFIGMVEGILKDSGLFEEVQEEFQLFKCRNWIVYARLGGEFAKDRKFSKTFFIQNYTSQVKLNLAFHHKLEMLAYSYNNNMGRALTSSMKQISTLIKF